MVFLNSNHFLQKHLRQLKTRFQSPLSRRVAFWIFAGIIMIEGIILIPSFHRREKELLSQIKQMSSGKVTWILITYPNASGTELIKRLQTLQANHSFLKGGAVYQSSGQLIGTFGNAPTLKPSQLENYSPQRQESFYDDVVWSGSDMKTPYTIILRHDASSVSLELNQYVARIIGLVAIISLFLTVTVWLTLEPLVLTPIFRLRRDLLTAGNAIYNDHHSPKFTSTSLKRNDELGDVISAFHKMFDQVTEAIYERKQAELALQESLTREEAYSQALDEELEKGRLMQTAFLPHQLLQPSGWEIAAFTSPAKRVAGDFYDVFELPNNHLAIVIADVCGKGVSAALFMGLFRSLIRIFAMQCNSVNQTEACLKAVELTNDYIAKNHGNEGMFATLFMGVINLNSHTLSYVNGGHEPLLLINSQGTIKASLEPTGCAVGMLPDVEFQLEEIILESGDLLVGYTDGVTEARDQNKKFFEREKVLEIMQKPYDSAQELLLCLKQSVLQHIGELEQSDDITILTLRKQ